MATWDAARLGQRRIALWLLMALGLSAAAVVPDPWPTLGHDPSRRAEGTMVGPDDPFELPAPWPAELQGGAIAPVAIDSEGASYVGTDRGLLMRVSRMGGVTVLHKASAPVLSPAALWQPMEGETTVYVGTDDSELIAVTTAGNHRWTAPVGNGNKEPIRSGPALTEISSRRWAVVATTETLYGVSDDLSSGTVRWAVPIRNSFSLPSSPALSAQGRVAVFAGSDSVVTCVETDTGNPVGNGQVFLGAVGRLTTPVADGQGNLYVGSERGEVFLLDDSCQLRTSIQLSAPVVADLAFDGHHLLANAAGELVGLDPSLSFLWSYALPRGFELSAPVLDSIGRVYLTGDVEVIALFPSTFGGLSQLWPMKLSQAKSGPLSTPALDTEGRILFTSPQGFVHVVDAYPAFRLAFHSDGFGGSYDLGFLREEYGSVIPGSVVPFSTLGSDDRQPSYGAGPERFAFASNRLTGRFDGFEGGRGLLDVDYTAPALGLPFTVKTREWDPAFTPIDRYTGDSRIPDRRRYLAVTSDVGGSDRIWFVDLPRHAAGIPAALPLTDWALQQAPSLSAVTFEPKGRAQSQPAFNPQGTRMAYRDCSLANPAECQVFVIAFDTKGEWFAPLGASVEQQLRGEAPAFSPDGRYVVVTTGTSFSIYDVTSPSRVSKPVVSVPAPSKGTVAHPSWSPDGTQIVAQVTDSSGRELQAFRDKRFSKPYPLTGLGADTDEPSYQQIKMPAPRDVSLEPARQVPGMIVRVAGRGFDIAYPQENEVYFTDVLRAGPVRAIIHDAQVNPATGLGELVVEVPDQAGIGPVLVRTRYGDAVSSTFEPIPQPMSLRPARSVPGARIRVLGVGFDLSPASANEVLFQSENGGTVGAFASSGSRTADGQMLIVVVPAGVADGPITVRSGSPQLGNSCCTFTRLRPQVRAIRNGPGMVETVSEVCDGNPLRVQGWDFPFDPEFGIGTGTVDLTVAGLSWDVNVPKAVFTPDPANPDLATFAPVIRIMPALGNGGGNQQVVASDSGLPTSAGFTFVSTPITTLPIIFVPGTSGTELVAATTFPRPALLADIHFFPHLPLHPFVVHGPPPANFLTFSAGEVIWPSVEMVLNLALTNGEGNHYLDVTAFTPNGGGPAFPTTIGNVIRTIPHPTDADIYGDFINFLSIDQGRPLMVTPVPGRPDPITGVYLFPYDWRDSMTNQANALRLFVDSVRAATGSQKVTLVTHSLGGPIARTYYLQSPANAAKVDQVISLGGGFGGVILPLKALVMGDDWGTSLPGHFGNVGVKEWEVQKLAQNWPTAYDQQPGTDAWFSDHGATSINGTPINRTFIRDSRRSAGGFTRMAVPPAIGAHSAWETMNLVTAGPNSNAQPFSSLAFHTSLFPRLSDFRTGTGPVRHHRIFTQGLQTVNAVELTEALLPLPNHTLKTAIMGDGDGTIPYHGLLGQLSAGDDRVYVLPFGDSDLRPPNDLFDPDAHDFSHAEMINLPQVRSLIGGLMNGSVCGVFQASALGFRHHTVVPENYQELPAQTFTEYEQFPGDVVP